MKYSMVALVCAHVCVCFTGGGEMYPEAYTFKYLVLSWRCYLGRLWNLCDTELSWKWITERQSQLTGSLPLDCRCHFSLLQWEAAPADTIFTEP